MSIRNWFSSRRHPHRGRPTAPAEGHHLAAKAALLCVFAAGCGGGSKPEVVKSASPPLPPPDTLAAKVFDFLQDTVVSPWVAEWPRPESREERSRSQADEDADETRAMVYRVQLYTTKDLSTAQSVSKEAEADFKQDVQVDYEVPYYKVRVGVFASPQAAEPVLQEARRLGYRGAWAVRVRASEQAP